MKYIYFMLVILQMYAPLTTLWPFMPSSRKKPLQFSFMYLYCIFVEWNHLYNDIVNFKTHLVTEQDFMRTVIEVVILDCH